MISMVYFYILVEEKTKRGKLATIDPNLGRISNVCCAYIQVTSNCKGRPYGQCF